MKYIIILLTLIPVTIAAQNLTEGLMVNDLSPHPMQEIEKPEYLESITDPSFGTTIRRITNAGAGEVIVPMYSTIQAWNADETLMILYNQSEGSHVLLDGFTYEFIRTLDDVSPLDLEQIFWDFNDPDIFYYPENSTTNFIRYTVSTETKETLVNLSSISECNNGISLGNDIQMMSWDSDVVTFRCNNESAYAYRISTGELASFTIEDLSFTAPAAGPSGTNFYHGTQAYTDEGDLSYDLNENSVEHSCIGKLANGNDAHFAISFAEGPDGGCLGDIIAHDLTTGDCFPLISQSQGYDYPQSGTHISALAHNNTEGGWVAASMIGYDLDGQSLLDQELVIARADQGDIKVCRIGHHRSDETEFDYWGEPHAVISPSGTRVLFGSDWSGAEDGISVDSYVVELPIYSTWLSVKEESINDIDFTLYPNPVTGSSVIELNTRNRENLTIKIYDSRGEEVISDSFSSNAYQLNSEVINSGMFYFRVTDSRGFHISGRFIKE